MAEIGKITLKEIASRVRYTFKLWDSTGHDQIPEDLLTHLINQAQIKISRDCKCVNVLNTTDTLTSGSRTYSFPDDFLELREFRVGADSSTGFRGFPLKIVKSQELDNVTGWRR